MIILIELTLSAVLFGQYPLLGELSHKNPVFKQLQADIDQFFRAEANNDLYPRLSIYQIKIDPHFDMLHLSARLNLPYDSLVSLNHLHSLELTDHTPLLLVPNMPGLYVPCNPESDLEYLMHSWRDFSDSPRITIRHSTENRDEEFYFLKGKKFHSMERVFLLQSFFRLPLEKLSITSRFGSRHNPFDNHLEQHRGVDMAAPVGTPVLAARAGTVLDMGYNDVYGNYILLSHQGEYQSLYAHLKIIKVQLKSEVYSGMIIGEVGLSGKTTGPHLHFEIRKRGEPTDPLSLFRM